MFRFLAQSSLAVSLVLGAVLLAGPAAGAQDTVPATATDVPPLLQQWLDAANAADGAAVAALYAEDGLIEDIPSGNTASGRSAIAFIFGGTRSPYRDRHWEPLAAHQAGDVAVLEYTFTATEQVSGTPLNHRGVIVFDLDGTQIRRSADYYDVATILDQLGLLGTGGAAPAAPPAQ